MTAKLLAILLTYRTRIATVAGMSPILSSLTDSVLASQVAYGNRQAFRELYDRYAARLYAFIRSRFPVFAEDICQETWMKAYQHLTTHISEMTNFHAWLFKMAKNRAIDRIRSTKMSSLADNVDVQDKTNPTALDHDIEREIDMERKHAVEHCLQQLEPQFRDVITSIIVTGNSGEEVARRLQITADLVYQRKKRGLAALSHCVESQLS